MLTVIKYIKVGREYLVLSIHKRKGIFVLSMVHEVTGPRVLDLFGNVTAARIAYRKVKSLMAVEEETVITQIAA